MSRTVKVAVWNEFRQEKTDPAVQDVYPLGIHVAIAEGLSKYRDLAVETATLDDPEQGLSEELLQHSDVLVWWGHKAHEEISNDTLARVQKAVLSGLGLVVLHSGHYSRIFRALLGTRATLFYREAAEKSRIWVVNPAHPVAAGIERFIELDREEMYGEPFEVPQPDELVFVSWFAGGQVFRSGLCYQRGMGRIFYFQPGHESYPTYHNPEIIRVIRNACRWAARSRPDPERVPTADGGEVGFLESPRRSDSLEPLEPLEPPG